MKAYEVYRQIHEKALEVGEALSAALIAAGRENLRWTPDGIVGIFRRDNRLVVEAEIEKDPRRHVKVLYADYCGLRDELIKLLQSDVQRGA